MLYGHRWQYYLYLLQAAMYCDVAARQMFSAIVLAAAYYCTLAHTILDFRPQIRRAELSNYYSKSTRHSSMAGSLRPRE